METIAAHTKPDEMERALSRFPFWDSLSKPQRDYLAQNAAVRHYAKGAMIHGGESSCLGMIYVLKGGIRVYLLSEEGREITLFRLEEGDPCVLSASCVIREITFETQMAAEADCMLLVVSSAVSKHLAEENQQVNSFMHELISQRFSTVMWTMQQILFAKLDRRLATFLLDEYDKTGSTEIHMTHAQIAQQISSAREAVARMLKRFVEDGLVELKRGIILLKDLEGLQSI